MDPLHRLRAFFRRSQLDADMKVEMQSHVDLQAGRNRAAGMEATEATEAARRQFGNVASLQEHARAQRPWAGLEQFLRDGRFALRQLARAPVFASVAILSLGVGVGACTAVFSVAHAALLRALPVPNPGELRTIQWSGVEARMRSFVGDSAETGNLTTADAVSPALFLELREKTAVLAEVFAFARLDDIAVRARAGAFTANGMVVSDNFFTGLAARPWLGRLFVPGETEALQVVITADWWESQFARNPDVIGQALTLNGRSCTVVGVLPPGFPGIRAGDPRNFYVPLLAGSPFLQAELTRNDFWWVRLMARLKPGTDDVHFKNALDLVFAREAQALMKSPGMRVLPGRTGAEFDRASHGRPLWLLLGVAGLVLLVACANLAGVLLARGEARRHELAVRAALGAGRHRLIRQALAESFVLAFLGGALGLLLAGIGQGSLSVLLARSVPGGLQYELSLDFTVLGFALTVVFVAALLAGLLPALRAGRVNAIDGLKARGAAGRTRQRTGKVLVVAQVGLSLLLLSSAGLFLRTLVNLQRIDAGFDPRRLVVFQLGTEAAGFTPAERIAFHARAQDSLAALPGVQGASLVMHALLDNQSWGGSFSFPGRPSTNTPEPNASRLVVGETFFTTLGIPVLHGRALNASDNDDAPKVIVVNEAFVRQYLPNENPLGQVVKVLRSDWRIVGVCRDVRHRNIKEPIRPVMYLSFRQFAFPRMSMMLQTQMPAATVLPLVRQAIAGLNPLVPVGHFSTQEQLRDDNIGPERLFAVLCGTLAGLALLLACIGLYGLMAFNVTRRTGEIGIRMALGARPADIAGPILRETLVLTGLGLAAGTPLLLAGTRFVKSQLYGVKPNDPLTFGLVALVLLAVALLAAWLPARRAAKVDPVIALRAE